MSEVLFANGRIVDVREGVVREAVVLVRDGEIVSVDPGPPVPSAGRSASIVGRPSGAGEDGLPGGGERPDASVVDLAGRYLLPGLLSLHVHPGLMQGFRNDPNGVDEARARRDLAIWPRFGVTTVQGLGTDRPYAFQVIRDRRPGEARYLSVGHGFGVRGGVPPFHIDPPGPYRESDPGFIQGALEELRERGASGVKLWYDDWYGQLPKMPAEIARLIIETSARLGLRTYAHVYRVADAKELVRLGVRTLAHMPRDRAADEELWTLMKADDVAVIPTLTVPDANVVYLDRPSFLDDPQVTSRLPEGAVALVRSEEYLAAIRAKPEFGRLRQDLVDALVNVAAAYRAGVRFAFGTDAGVSQRIVGFGEHRELGLLVTAGVRPADAIRMATLGSAEVLGRADLGEIAAGRRADLVVLREDPLAEVRAMRTIESVWIDGARVAGPL